MNAARLPLLFAIALLASACKPAPSTPPPEPSRPVEPPAPVSFSANDVVAGTGEPIKSGQIAVVHYTGWLYDSAAADHHGQQFDSSRTHGSPFRFPVGGGRVIRGWDEGVVGMKVGGRRELVIPPDLGYGAQGAGGVIPPNATLLFDVELLGME